MTGTGLLITERIPFGHNGIEPQHAKCLDYRLGDPLPYYRTLVTALARLAGWPRCHGAEFGSAADFPVDLHAATVGEQPPLRADRIERQLEQLVDFAATHPGLLPEPVRDTDFWATLVDQLPRLADREAGIWQLLAANPDHLALRHWNANIDNAWFWREGATLRCGLMDWGCVGRMNVAMALWGCLSGAENTLWEDHFDELAQLFVDEFSASGGPHLDTGELSRQVLLYASVMAAAWLLRVPALIRARVGEQATTMTRFDPAISDDEAVRAPLQMLTNVLTLWRTRDLASALPA